MDNIARFTRFRFMLVLDGHEDDIELAQLTFKNEDAAFEYAEMRWPNCIVQIEAMDEPGLNPLVVLGTDDEGTRLRAECRVLEHQIEKSAHAAAARVALQSRRPDIPPMFQSIQAQTTTVSRYHLIALMVLLSIMGALLFMASRQTPNPTPTASPVGSF